MSKIYHEMSEAERQLHLISNNLDYAVCVLSEGLPGPENQFNGITKDMYGELISNITNHLLMALSGVNLLLESVDNERKAPPRIPQGLLAEILQFPGVE